MEFTVKHTLTQQRIADVLCSALDAGWIDYWADIEKHIEPSSWDYETDDPKAQYGHYDQDYPVNPGGALVIRDTEDNRWPLRLDQESLQKGLSILAEKYPYHFSRIIDEEFDAETGDVLIQCSLLGDIVYG